MRILKGLAVVALVAVAAGYWLFARESVPETTDFVVETEALGAAAGSTGGRLPVAVHHVEIARASMPRAAVFGGFDFSPHENVHGVFQVVYGDGRYGMVDAGFGRGVFEGMAERGEARYDAAAFEAVRVAMARADWILLTHEHPDHVQGLAELDAPLAVAPRIVFNRAQHQNPTTATLLPPELLAAIEPRDLDGPVAIAPGVAVQPARGHTPGSQLVFVRLASGTDLLLIGDVAWHLDAIRHLEYRPRLVTDFYLGEDRRAVLAQYRALHDMLGGPGPVLVPSHDGGRIAELVRDGYLRVGLAGR